MRCNYINRLCKITVLLIAFAAFNSCYIWENRYVNGDYSCYESYQICNTLQQDIVLRFYEKGKSKTVYAEIYNQTSLISIDKSEAEKDAGGLLKGDQLTLKFGQTLLLYEPTSTYEGHLRVTNLTRIGSHLLGASIRFIGDSMTVSIENGAETPLPIRNAELWETWYDEKEYIYYHLWRVE